MRDTTGATVLKGSSLALALALAAGCATARNYEDPARPLYAGGTASAPQPEPTLRVVTFNIKWGRHVDRAAELFSRPGPLHGADLIVLEEMDRPGTERLARELGLSWVYVPSAVHPVPDHDFGVALLSPWPLEDPRKLLLPHLSRFRKLRRSATVATLRSPLGPVRVYGVHLESFAGASGKMRREQAQAVLRDAAAWKGAVVVAGDFNGRGGARVMSSAGFEWVTEPVKNTAGPFDLDHILARGLCAAATPAAGRADDATDASDHDPVWAVFRPCAPAPVPVTAGS